MRRRSVLQGMAAAVTGPFLPASSLAQQPPNLAMVIGNSDYEAVQRLPNAVADAQAVRGVFQSLGLTVGSTMNCTGESLSQTLNWCARNAEGGAISLIYYAGHGIEVDGEDYLLPIETRTDTPEAAGRSLVPVTQILRNLLGRAGLTVFLGDACRTNPFGEAHVTVEGNRDAIPLSPESTRIFPARGPTPLAAQRPIRLDEPPPHSIAELGASNLVVSFSTSEAQPASDGISGGHSPYAKALLDFFAGPNPPISDLFAFLDERVLAATGGRQRPQVWSFG